MKLILLQASLFLFCSAVSAQNVGIGTITPQAKLDVKGNLRIGGNSNALFYDSLSGKFTWTNSYLYLPTPQYIIRHSASSEGLFYGSSQLEYRYQDGTPRFYTNWTTGNGYFFGNLGIGTQTPQFPLHFKAVLGDKISLWGDAAGSPFYGFGIQPNTLQIHTDASFSDISFGYGSSSSYTEVLRIKGTGDLYVNGSSGSAGQVLTSNGSGSAPAWKSGSPKYFYFQRTPGNPISITITYTSIPGIDGQSFTTDFPSNLVITFAALEEVDNGETVVQDVDLAFEVTAFVGYRSEGYTSIKPQSGTFVTTHSTFSVLIPNVPAGTYTLQYQIRKFNSAGNAKYIESHVIVEAIPI